MADVSFRIENVVSVAELGVDIPLDDVSGEHKRSGYQPEQFEGLVYKPGREKVASLVFPSGKIVCTGAKSIKEAKGCIDKVVGRLREKGTNVPKKYKVNVENMLASATLGTKLDLEKLASSMKGAEYNPDQLPCVVYRMPKAGVSFLLFGSGKAICTGGRSEKIIGSAFRKLREVLGKAGVTL
jgi:transcription initiation factor TFIID TATA-box-binding protein